MDDHLIVVAGARISEPDPIRAQAQDALTLVEPRPFGGYTVVATLGRGGTGDVFLALSAGFSGFKKVIVLKVLHEAFAKERASLEAFLEEARIAARLQHSNVVQIYEIGEAEGRHYVAMEYAAGMSLDRILRECRNRGRLLPATFCARIAAEVLTGLAYAHDLEAHDGEPVEVVHGGVSPANILVGWDGTVKVVDFGTSKARGRRYDGFVRGRDAYVAPEQGAGLPYDRRADVFAVGAVLFEMLTGTRPVRSGEAGAPASAEPPQVTELRPEVPAVLADIVALALQRDGAERYPSAAQMRDDLEAWLAEQREVTRDDVAATLGDYFEGERERQHVLLNESVGGVPLTATHTGSFAVPPPMPEPSSGEPAAASAAPSREPMPLAPIGLALLALLAVLLLAAARGREVPATAPSTLSAPAQVR